MFSKGKLQQKKDHSGWGQLYTNMQTVSDVFKGYTSIRRVPLMQLHVKMPTTVQIKYLEANKQQTRHLLT